VFPATGRTLLRYSEIILFRGRFCSLCKCAECIMFSERQILFVCRRCDSTRRWSLNGCHGHRRVDGCHLSAVTVTSYLFPTGMSPICGCRVLDGQCSDQITNFGARGRAYLLTWFCDTFGGFCVTVYGNTASMVSLVRVRPVRAWVFLIRGHAVLKVLKILF